MTSKIPEIVGTMQKDFLLEQEKNEQSGGNMKEVKCTEKVDRETELEI